MATPAHTDFDSANPQGSQTPAAFATSALNDLRALRDAILSGRLEGFVQSRAAGTGTVTQPQFITWLNATLTMGFRWNITWSGFTIASIADEWSNDNGATWTAINTAQANTYDASNNITASTQAGGQRGVLFEVWTKVLKVVSDFATHAASTGPAVHGLGTMALQAASAIAVTGGAMDAVNVGDTTRGRGSFTRVVENLASYAPALNATFSIDWSLGGSSVTTNGSHILQFVTIPTGAAGHMLYLDNFNNIGTWPASVNWGVGGKPSIAGAALVALTTFDAGATVRPSIAWQAV